MVNKTPMLFFFIVKGIQTSIQHITFQLLLILVWIQGFGSLHLHPECGGGGWHEHRQLFILGGLQAGGLRLAAVGEGESGADRRVYRLHLTAVVSV